MHLISLSGRIETPLLLRTADCSGHLSSHRQAADPVRHLFVHHQELPVLQNSRQRMAGTETIYFPKLGGFLGANVHRWKKLSVKNELKSPGADVQIKIYS